MTAYAAELGVASRDARLFMIFDGRWKMMHAEGGFRPMLFDLVTDPDEFHDLGADPDCTGEIDRLYGGLRAWGLRMAQRVTMSEADISAGKARSGRRGILPFLYDGSEVRDELTAKIRGPAGEDYTRE